MFSGIKDKLLNVTKNVGLFTTENDPRKSKTQAHPFNPQAGAGILQHFQDQWVEIHATNESNASAAHRVALQIDQISSKLATSKTNVDLIAHVLTGSNLTSNIAQCLRQVQELYTTCETVESKLLDLENLLEEVDFDRMVVQHRHHLENYKARKQESLDTLTQALDEAYKKKLVEHEQGKKQILEERQKVFQEAFKSDLELYKSLGTIPKVDLPKGQNGAILEEIQLDFDQNELEHFFDEEGSHS